MIQRRSSIVSPPVSAVVVGTDQLPAELTGLVPISVPSMLTVTVAPGSPVPVIVGVSSLIVEPSSGAVITGGSGMPVSRVNVDVASGEVFPPSSVWVAVTV